MSVWFKMISSRWRPKGLLTPLHQHPPTEPYPQPIFKAVLSQSATKTSVSPHSPIFCPSTSCAHILLYQDPGVWIGSETVCGCLGGFSELPHTAVFVGSRSRSDGRVREGQTKLWLHMHHRQQELTTAALISTNCCQ